MFNKRKRHHHNEYTERDKQKMIAASEAYRDDDFEEDNGDIITSSAVMADLVKKSNLKEFDEKVSETAYKDIDLVKQSNGNTLRMMELLATYHSSTASFPGNWVVASDKKDERDITLDMTAPHMMVGSPIGQNGEVTEILAPIIHTTNGGWRYTSAGDDGRIKDIAPVNSAMLMGDMYGCEGLYTPLHDPDAVADSICFLEKYIENDMHTPKRIAYPNSVKNNLKGK